MPRRAPSPLRGGIEGGGIFKAQAIRDLTPAALINALQAGPTNAHPERPGGIPFSLARYAELFATLPAKIQAEVTARWGAPEADPSLPQVARRFGVFCTAQL